GQQALDEAGFPVVVTHADVAAEATLGVDRLAELAQPAVHSGWRSLGGPLEGRVRLGNEAADGDRAADVLAATGSAAGTYHLVGHRGDLQHVLVGLGGQPAHEVQLHLPPAAGVGGADRADEVRFGDRLVDDAPNPLAAALWRERQPGPLSVAGQL